ncbi:hypothetical protein [Streptomyces atroolivaceus]|uniref:hypothetical protein n=1 Tax=Streptomyces atroolivaceus TaxID=66869 RepID=UPI0020244A1F|nr:hypothetical protein [Streptomyces atroolivaceus]
MSDIAATTVHEAYAFACMRCGYGWEQAYEIEHHVDGSGNAFVVYKADGQRVPSPLSTPTCANCGGHVVRLMRAGRVSTVQQLLRHGQTVRPKRAGEETAAEEMAVAAVRAPGPAPHHWQLSDLLRHFHRR